MANEKRLEEWKDIPNYEGLYQASTLGRIRSVDKEVECESIYGKKYKQKKRGKVLKPYPQANGYMTVTLYKNGEENFAFVHRLLAMTFLKNTKDRKVVSFVDGNKYNITLDNLCWGKAKKLHS